MSSWLDFKDLETLSPARSDLCNEWGIKIAPIRERTLSFWDRATAITSLHLLSLYTVTYLEGSRPARFLPSISFYLFFSYCLHSSVICLFWVYCSQPLNFTEITWVNMKDSLRFTGNRCHSVKSKIVRLSLPKRSTKILAEEERDKEGREECYSGRLLIGLR